MASRGKSINLFLMDGEINGRIKCTLANWTGVAYKIPRTELDKCNNREDLKQSGVYFLFGTDEETDKKVVYIGQAGIRKNGEGILNRLKEHKRNAKKEYWNEAIIFTTSNNTFGPTEISYLENRFTNLALEANRYEVQNGNDPNPGHLTEEKESEMEDYIDNAQIIMGTFGHKVFEPLAKKTGIKSVMSVNSDNATQNELLYFKRTSKKSKQTTEATGLQTAEGFVVLKGSMIEVIDSKAIPNSIKKLRKTASIDSNNILQEDQLFSSPSYAAAFVYGSSVNGLIYWKNAQGQTLKEIEEFE